MLVGHSLGGLIVRLYAHQNPQDVAGLVLVDPMHEDQFERIGPLIPAAFPGEPDTLTQFRRFWTTEWRDPTKNQEGVDFVACQTQMHALGALGAIPLLVLTADDFLRHAPPGDPGAARMHRMWLDMHQELMRQSSNAQHFLQREQPELVGTAIRQMVRTINGRTS